MKAILAVPMAVALLLCFSFAAPAKSQTIENNDPSIRLTITDSRTYVTYYSREKKYEALEGLLNRELYKIESDCREVKRNPKSEKKCDQEGQMYVLDDLADLYAYGQIDFEKAKDLNSRTAKLYKQINKAGLPSVPRSPYFNARRFAYYTFYLDKGFFDDEATMVSAFDKKYIEMVRQRDFDQLGERIEKRTRFLNSKLGLSSSDMSDHSSKIVDPKLFRAYMAFIDTVTGYTDFERAYMKAGLAAKALEGGGPDQELYLQTILKAESVTMVDVRGDSIALMDKMNRLNYWITMASLRKKQNAKAITHHEHLINGIDRMEKAKRERIQAMVDLLNKHYQEDLESTNAWRNAGKSFLAGLASAGIVLGKVLATAGAAVGDVAIGNSHATLSEGAYKLLWKDKEFDYGANEAIMESDFLNPLYELDEGNPNRLDEFMSTYALSLNRYLNKYEMRSYLASLGNAYASQRKREDAIRQYSEAIDIIEIQRGTIAFEKQRMAFFSSEQELYPKIISQLVVLGRYGEALEYVERSKSRAFLDILGSSHVTFKSVRQKEAVQLNALAMAEIDSILDSANSQGEQGMHASAAVNRAIAVHGGINDNSMEEIHTLSSVSVLDYPQIRKLVPEDSTMIEYYLDKSTLYIFTITNKKIQCKTVLISQPRLIQDIKQLRGSILAQNYDKKTATKLYTQLVRPVEDSIKAKRLIIVPHMALHYLPFQTLLDDERYLVQDHAVSYIPSATLLSIVEKKRPYRKQRALVVGNPTGDLKFAEQEAIAIGNTLPNATVVLGANATESLLKKQSDRYAVIHIASHGEFDPTNPMASRILLNSGNGDDGDLQTNELFGCQWRASLVTLSACQSGIGGYASGDELVGLQRGVFFAGTQSLLASTWRVDDASTSYLMARFYVHAMKDTKDVALQKAQLETSKKFEQPFHWASFRLIGAANQMFYNPTYKKKKRTVSVSAMAPKAKATP